jgi:DNA mismatch repair ATPase MutL
VNSTSNTNYTSNNNNTNTNNSTSSNTNNNNNTNNSTVNSTSQNNSDINTQSNNTNTNNNNTTSSNKNENINRNETVQKIEQDIKSPPPSAIAPSIGSSYSQDLCTVGIGGAVQTQLFGLSGGGSVRDENCERIKLSKTLYDMGMKVASVSLMCQDQRVWDAMRMAGTPCPYEGKIGDEAQAEWDNNPKRAPDGVILSDNSETLKSDDDTEYRVWSKEDFCEEYPEEKVCK